MIYYTTLKDRCEVHNEKTIKRNQKTCIIGNVYGNWSDSSVYNRSNPTDWQYAASNAYTGIILRLGLWQYGMMVGFILPLLRYLLFGMPPIFPIGVSMTFELAAYGAVIGLIMQQLSKKSAAGKGKNYVLNLYVSLIGAMLAGRLVWGLVRFILTQVTMEPFTFEMFMAGAFLGAIPGIVIQVILIPGVMVVLERAGVLKEDGTAR